MLKKLYTALWNWQNSHTAPRFISLNTGEVVSVLGRLMAGEYFGENEQYVWVSLKKYRTGRYDALLAGEAESVTDFLWF